MTLSVLIIDTSYLVELYRVPGRFNADCADRIRSRFAAAIDHKSRLYVPFPVLFEVGNHIVQVDKGGVRRELALKFAADIRTSVEDESPWIIAPAGNRDLLLELADFLILCQSFASDFAPQQVGLTDTALIHEARRLKRERYTHADHKVHIWTKDKRLKSHEPDAEPNPFLG